jgi:hypothetical protein
MENLFFECLNPMDKLGKIFEEWKTNSLLFVHLS